MFAFAKADMGFIAPRAAPAAPSLQSALAADIAQLTHEFASLQAQLGGLLVLHAHLVAEWHEIAAVALRPEPDHHLHFDFVRHG